MQKNEEEAYQIMREKIDNELNKLYEMAKADESLYDGPISDGGSNHGETQGAVWPQ